MPDDKVEPVSINGIHIMADVDISKYQWMGISREGRTPPPTLKISDYVALPHEESKSADR